MRYSGHGRRVTGYLVSGLERSPRRLTGLLEVEDGAALGDLRRIYCHPDVLFDPLGGPPRGLVGAGFVLTDGHGLSTAVGAACFVAGKAGNGADEGLHVV